MIVIHFQLKGCILAKITRCLTSGSTLQNGCFGNINEGFFLRCDFFSRLLKDARGFEKQAIFLYGVRIRLELLTNCNPERINY